MKHNMGFKRTGMCFVCGKPTQLLIHQKCGQKPKKNGGKKVKKYSEAFISALIKESSS